jgi:hypothetical protein
MRLTTFVMACLLGASPALAQDRATIEKLNDAWITAIDQPEAQDIRQCLLSRYETSPAGALSVRDMVIPTRQFVSVGHYGVRCVAPDLGGGVPGDAGREDRFPRSGERSR